MGTRRGDPTLRRPVHRGPIETWGKSSYDAALHLLDRQIVDVDGMAVGKVDDVELVAEPDGSLVPTGLMVGMAALLPRFGDRLGDRLFQRWVRLAPADAERSRPGLVEMELVEDVTSEVHLSVPRDGLLHVRDEGGTEPTRRRLGDLLAMKVVLDAGAGLARGGRLRVLDVRLSAGEHPTPRVAALIIGHGRPGSLLGYERSSERGPWLVARLVRQLHRHSRLVDLGPDVELDWEARVVRIGPGAHFRPIAE
jgi:hypothetical protein